MPNTECRPYYGPSATADRAERLRKEAAELAKRIDQAFWMPERDFFAMALDGEKQLVKCITSNPGHLLFTRLLNRERARAVITRLMRDDMFSGWGWRTCRWRSVCSIRSAIIVDRCGRTTIR